jgi:hypothetical protein
MESVPSDQLHENMPPDQIVVVAFEDWCEYCERPIVPGDECRIVDRQWIHAGHGR